MKKRIILAVLLLGMLVIPTSLSAWTQWYTPYGSSYVPALMYIDPAGNPQYPQSQWAPPAKNAAHTWNVLSPCWFSFGIGGTWSGIVPWDDDHNQIVWQTLDPLILGITYLVTNGPNREGDHKFTINPSPYSWCMGPGLPSYSQVDFETVALHEFGHNLALGHSTDPNAVMYQYVTVGVAHRYLGTDDMAGGNALYPSNDGGGAMGATLNGLPAGLDLKVNNAGNNAQISFSMPNAATVNVKIYDATGRVVQTIVDANLNQGEHTYNWNTNNLNAGVYFVSVETASENATAKFVVLK